MATSPILAGFDADAFRSVILDTMTMGLPEPTELRPTFYFRSTVTYPPDAILDTEGRPIDPRVQAATVPASPPIQVPCAVEFTQDTTNPEGLSGTFWSDRAAVTLLDIHYQQVADAIEVDLAGRRYLIQQMTAVGLGPVTVYTFRCFRKGTGE